MTPGGSSAPPHASAGLSARALAALLDTLISVAAGLVLGVPAIAIIVLGGTWTRRPDGARVLESVPPAGLVLLAVALLALVAVAAWNRGIRQGRTGQSLGKRRLGLFVVTRDSGESLGAGRGLLRWVLSLVLALPCLLTYLWAVVDRQARTWHDLLADAWVVRR
ncbi:hypothetical protein D9V41_08250 [Aeromicrobium phragmitis]|uniref:RDD domain-containing protein n=1 Tax=Aeromicrobium phragmitis TaxID=2478914 RepID=A0A3L8PN17_9ACTN|nr:RDD family protein [Aeromicrobium phragmitis]RLV55888.1 hypothetical protein D9V41_08250 [Aeromicrobium phragmitis]